MALRGRSFAALKLFTATYLALMFKQRWEMGPLVCILKDKCTPGFHERAEVRFHMESQWAAWWLVPSAMALTLFAVRGMARRSMAVLLLVAWRAHHATIDVWQMPVPQVGFVSLTLLYIAIAPLERDTVGTHGHLCMKVCTLPLRRQTRTNQQSLIASLAASANACGARLALLRLYLLVAYATSGYGKLLLTPAWTSGNAIGYLARAYMRQGVPLSLAAAIASASRPLSACVLLLECNLPLIEAASLLGFGSGSTRHTLHTVSVLGWILSAANQCLLLILTPFTDVCTGAVLFHAALFDAALADAHDPSALRDPDFTRDPDHVRDRRLRTGRGSAALLAAVAVLFSSRPLQCAIAPSWRPANHPSLLGAVAISFTALMPLPRCDRLGSA